MKYKPKTKQELKKLIKNENIYLGDIDTSLITDMSKLFFNTFREDFSGIENWNVSNVRDMSEMLCGCSDFNQDIGNWNVSNVEDMKCMLYGCYNFNRDIGNWNVSNVRNINSMLAFCSNFNQDISKWDISNDTDKSYMLADCPIEEHYKPRGV